MWRWSPFFGICLSKSSATPRCTTYGAYAVVSAVEGRERPSQCASMPSPRLLTIPMPVIQTSRASAMGEHFHGERDLRGDILHAGAERRVRKFDQAECELGAAHRLALTADLRLRDGEARTVVHQLRRGRKLLAGGDEGAQFRLLHRGKERHAGEF